MKATVRTLLVLALAGCLATPIFAAGGKEDAPAGGNTAAPASKAADLKVAILLPSSPTDGGWGQMGATGIKKAAEIYGFKPVIVEAATADLMKREAESLAQEGFQLIFGHGGQYASPFKEIRNMYPETYFITAGGNVTGDNQIVAEYVVEQLSYIQGVMAARLSKTQKLGLVVGGNFPAYTKTSRGFTLGAKSVNPNIEVMFAITQNAADMNEGYELTLSQINAGADVVWSNANAASQGSIKAARETNTLKFCMVADQQKEAPDQIIASIVQDYNVLATEVVKRYLNGTLEGGYIKLGVPEKGITWVWNEAMKAKLPADVTALYDELQPKTQSGEIYVPSENEGW